MPLRTTAAVLLYRSAEYAMPSKQVTRKPHTVYVVGSTRDEDLCRIIPTREGDGLCRAVVVQEPLLWIPDDDKFDSRRASRCTRTRLGMSTGELGRS